ncbi:MAG: hypothetical protein JXR83_06480 [Deltaproteobacteria bacterium]|nr:hypothetical protein [Deltaproteobacteria bacterium]
MNAVKKGVVAVLLLASGGCFGLWHRIDRAALDRIPNEEKLTLFDAENDVIISKDDIEAVEREISDGRVATKRAREKVDLLKDNQEVAGITSPDVLALYNEWAQLRLELREDEMRHLYVKRDLVGEKLWLARARYELAKAQLVHDHDPERGADVDVPAFENQVKDKEAIVQQAMAKLDESKIILEEIRNRYDATSARLQEASGGAFGGPWAD